MAFDLYKALGTEKPIIPSIWELLGMPDPNVPSLGMQKAQYDKNEREKKQKTVTDILGATATPTQKPQTWEDIERIARETDSPIPEHRYKEFGKPTPTPTQVPTPTQAPTQTPTSAPIPKPTPTPVQEWYRNPAIGKGVEATPAFKTQYDTATKAIERYAQQYGVPVNLMTDIAFTESSFDPHEGSNKSSATGLFQFTNDTWTDAKGHFGNTINRRSAEDSAMVAAWFISRGYLGKWDNSLVMIDDNGVDHGWGQFYLDDDLLKYYGLEG